LCAVPKAFLTNQFKAVICFGLALALAPATMPQARAQSPVSFDGAGSVIRIAAKDQDTGSSSPTVLDHTIGTCAGAYHSALSHIGATHGEALGQAIKSAQSGWRKLKGRWLFPPRRSIKDKGFRWVVRRAAPFVRRRGIDPKLRQTVQTQLIARMATDLKVYVGQRAAPALCTGAVQYMDFFDNQLVPFRRDRESAAELFERAAQMADWKLGSAERALRTPLVLRGNEDTDLLTARERQLTKLFATARAIWSTIVDADGTEGLLFAHVSALAHSRIALKQVALKRRSPLRARYFTLYTAFTAVEALAYIQTSHAKYQEIAAGFGNTIAAVRSAHSKICGCAK